MRVVVALFVLTFVVGYALASSLYVGVAGSNAGPNDCLTAASPCATIVYALSVAVDGDEVLVGAGSYSLTGTIVVSKRVTIRSELASSPALLEAAGAATVLAVRIDGVVVRDLQFRVGLVISDAVFGGAVSIVSTFNVLVEAITVTMPVFPPAVIAPCVREGVGVYISDSSAITVRGCSFEGLLVCAQGGGIFISDSTGVLVDSCVFGTSLVQETTGLGGAGLFYTASSEVDVTNSRFFSLDSKLRDGGAIFGAGAAGTTNVARFTDCVFDSCAGADGGVVYLLYATATFTRCNFTGNSAEGSAGVLYAFYAEVQLVDCVFDDNAAQTGGVALFQTVPSLLVSGSTFSGNSAVTSGALEFRASVTLVTVVNSVFSDNTATDTGSVLTLKESALVASAVRVIDNLCVSGGGIVVDGSSTLVMEDSQFVTNVGEAGAAIATLSTATAVVRRSSFVGNRAASVGGALSTTQNSRFTGESLTFAFNTAESTGGAIYTFGTGQLSLTDVSFTAGVSSYGGGCMFCDFATQLVMANVSFANCTTVTGEGGAVYLRQATSGSATDILFSDNSATVGGGLYATSTTSMVWTRARFELCAAESEGGAVYLDRDAVATFDTCTFERNMAPIGAGISLFGQPTVQLIDTTMSNHTAASRARTELPSAGGAVYCLVAAVVRVVSSRFENNSVSANGGSLMTQSCRFIVTDSIFIGNSAGVFGGAMFVDASTSVVDSLFETNVAAWGGALYYVEGAMVVRTDANVQRVTFRDNFAAGAGGALYWESIAPAFVPSCVGCVHVGNVANGYGSDEATASSRINIIVINGTETVAASPPLTIEASRSFEVYVTVHDYFGALYKFSDPRAFRSATVEVSAESLPAGEVNATVIGASLVALVDGYASFSGLFLRGSETNRLYYLAIRTVPASTVTRWVTNLEACEPGFAQIANVVVLFECVECASGFFDTARTSRCTKCPRGAICEGTTRIFALRDWWWDPESPDENPQYYQCVPNRCCPVSEPGNRCLRTLPCAEGWNQSSTLCSRCIAGHYEWNNKCIECSGSQRWRAVLVFVICAALVSVLFLMGSKVGAELRIFIYFAQATALVIGPVHQTMPYFGIALGQLDILSVDEQCFVRLTALRKLLSGYAVPVLLFGLLTLYSLVYLAIKLVVRQRRKRASYGEHVPHVPLTRLFNAYINLAGICTVPLLHTSLHLVICRKVGSRFVLNLAPDVECYKAEHLPWMILAAAITAVYVFALPFALFFYRRHVTMALLQKRFWRRDHGLLANHMYKPHMFWWEVVLVARDVLLVTNYVLWFSVPERRVIAIMMVNFLFLIVHSLGMPFIDAMVNAVENFSMVALAFSAFLVHYPYRFQLEDPERDATIRDLMLYAGAVLTGGYVMLRIAYNLLAPRLCPLHLVTAGDFDVHHTPHI